MRNILDSIKVPDNTNITYYLGETCTIELLNYMLSEGLVSKFEVVRDALVVPKAGFISIQHTFNPEARQYIIDNMLGDNLEEHAHYYIKSVVISHISMDQKIDILNRIYNRMRELQIDMYMLDICPDNDENRVLCRWILDNNVKISCDFIEKACENFDTDNLVMLLDIEQRISVGDILYHRDDVLAKKSERITSDTVSPSPELDYDKLIDITYNRSLWISKLLGFYFVSQITVDIVSGEKGHRLPRIKFYGSSVHIMMYILLIAWIASSYISVDTWF